MPALGKAPRKGSGVWMRFPPGVSNAKLHRALA
jgi:hypothetical protein